MSRDRVLFGADATSHEVARVDVARTLPPYWTLLSLRKTSSDRISPLQTEPISTRSPANGLDAPCYSKFDGIMELFCICNFNQCIFSWTFGTWSILTKTDIYRKNIIIIMPIYIYNILPNTDLFPHWALNSKIWLWWQQDGQGLKFAKWRTEAITFVYLPREHMKHNLFLPFIDAYPIK